MALCFLNFNPQAGHDQAGHRPALVISPAGYNSKVGLAILCPITSRRKGYPFEVTIPDGHNLSGVILADQVKSLDWRIHQATCIEPMPAEVIAEVLAKLETLIRP